MHFLKTKGPQLLFLTQPITRQRPHLGLKLGDWFRESFALPSIPGGDTSEAEEQTPETAPPTRNGPRVSLQAQEPLNHL